MMIEPLAPATPLIDTALSAGEPSVATGTPNFSTWFSNELSAVNERLVQSDQDSQALATGSVQSLHDVMIRMEEARQSFQLLLQVRNRLLEAYQDVMRTQV
jgi:flagellar hook-basal body complex protein FliE